MSNCESETRYCTILVTGKGQCKTFLGCRFNYRDLVTLTVDRFCYERSSFIKCQVTIPPNLCIRLEPKPIKRVGPCRRQNFSQIHADTKFERPNTFRGETEITAQHAQCTGFHLIFFLNMIPMYVHSV